MEEPHKCKYCGVETTQPDEECYAKPETLEEAAHKMLVDYGIKSMGQSIGVLTVKKLMVDMAQWQAERMYSEEEVRKIAEEVRWQAIGDPLEFTKNFEEWFEQFKK